MPDFMLAARGRPEDLLRLHERGHVFDLKVDGVRAMVTCDRDRLTLLSRNDKDFAGRFPELLGPLDALRSRSLVLDAEIAVPDRRGLPSWPLTQRRTARQSGAGTVEPHLQARLYVFDVLRLDGADTTGRPFTQRRALLQELAAQWPAELVLTVCSEEPAGLWDLVLEHHLEGVIAKRADAPYRPGRSPDWVKVKAVHTVTCLVGGVTWGSAHGSDPRSLDLYLVDADGSLVPVGSCSAGVGAAMRRELVRRLRTPPLVVEVEYSQVTPARVLRHPVLRALRDDVGVLDCALDQLPADP